MGRLAPELAQAITAGRALRADAAQVRLIQAQGMSTSIMLNTASVGIYPELVQRR